MRFQLNMQILCDVFLESFQDVTFYSDQDRPCLEGVRICPKAGELDAKYVYLLPSLEALTPYLSVSGIGFILLGAADPSRLPSGCPILTIEDAADLSEVLTLAQNTFELYEEWDRTLNLSLSAPYPLDSMLKASLKIFHNPIFIHDPNFYILSCPHRAPGMMEWERDPRTGWDIVPLSRLHEFKVELEYLNTLNTKEPSLYPSGQRGYPILYQNLWNEGRYEGRICVDELETALRPGQYLAIEYLGKLIISSIKTGNLFRLSMGNDLEQFFRNYLDGNIEDQSLILRFLYFMNWNRHDRYLCLRLEAEQHDIQMLSSAATLGHIETQIPGGHAFLYKNGITVVTNLTYSNSRSSDVISSLAILLREGLLKMGASSEIRDFLQLPQGCLQAQVALELGQASSSMNWCYRFDDYLLEYLLKKGGEYLSPELLCSSKLRILKQYDEDNRTEFYRTLKLFLELERNVLQTAKALFIHRSTLFYRLERIQKIADVNLDDAKERLILRISFYILEE